MQIDLAPDKCREFTYDCIFGAESNNTQVYDVVAGPIVDGVMRGINGTVLAYGQTGSGKTHSLGILTRVTGETGIIPRALSHIFGYIAQAESAGGSKARSGSTYTVTMSFLQLYLDTVQDLLASGTGGPSHGLVPQQRPGSANGASTPSSNAGNDTSFSSVSGSRLNWPGQGSGPGAAGSSSSSAQGSGGGQVHPASSHVGPGLAVREDPARGFYVEGLSEYNVSNFSQALTLLNIGLENRVLGSTRMNATSSRSHTVLMVKIECREPMQAPHAAAAGAADGQSDGAPVGYLTRRSQLMLCDLAGSERVRRTSSRGARLEEARAINASLHTLGQVITALAILAQHNGNHHNGPRPHVPWRDSKLTRLLYGNLGGASNTYLLATVGPAARNANETLSTLLFASRCMRVTATPVASLSHAQVDYADLAARLQARLADLEASHAAEVGAIQGRYESALASLASRLEDKEREQQQSGDQGGGGAAALLSGGSGGADGPTAGHLDSVTVSLSLDGDDADGGGLGVHDGGGVSIQVGRALYHLLVHVFDTSVAAIQHNNNRVDRHRAAWARATDKARAEEAAAEDARLAMGSGDPMALARQMSRGPDDGSEPIAAAVPDPASFGPHLGFQYRSAARAIQSVHHQHDNNSTSGGVAGSTGGDGGIIDVDGSDGSDASGRPAPSARGLLSAPAVPQHMAVDPTTASPQHPTYESLTSKGALLPYCQSLAQCASLNIARMDELFKVKDGRFDEVKRHLAACEAAVRVRDEDVQNQRYVLKYLVDTTGHLRDELRAARASAGLASGGGHRGSVNGGHGRQRSGSVSSTGGASTASLSPIRRLSGKAGTSIAAAAAGGSTEIGLVDGGKGDASFTAYLGIGSSDSAISDARQEAYLGLSEGSGDGDADAEGAVVSPLSKMHNRRGNAGADNAASLPLQSTLAGSTPQAVASSGLPLRPSGPVAAAASSSAAMPGRPPRPPPRIPVYTSSAASQQAPSAHSPSMHGGNVYEHQQQSVDFDGPEAVAAGDHDDLTAHDDEDADDGDDGDAGDEDAGADTIERIVAHRVVHGPVAPDGAPGRASLLYKVHWVGSTPDEDEWFSRDDLLHDFPHQVADYEALISSGAVQPTQAR